MAGRASGGEIGGLLYQAHRAARAAANAAMRGDGIELAHLGILAHLVDGGPRRQQRIGDALGLDKSTLGRLVAELERRGLVERRRSPEDGRAHDVSVTPEGSARLRSGRRHADAAVTELLVALSPDERDTLCGLLRRVVAAPGGSSSVVGSGGIGRTVDGATGVDR